MIIILLVTGVLFLIFCAAVVDRVCLDVGVIFAFFWGVSFVPFDERLSDVEIIFLFVSVSSDIVDVTGTLSRSISVMRAFVGVVFFGIRFIIGLEGGITLLVFCMTFGFTVAVGLFSTLVGGSGGVIFFANICFRSSKSLWSDDDDSFRRTGGVTHECLSSTIAGWDCFGGIVDEIGWVGLGTLSLK